MATIASKENANNQPCEFHQTNNLDKLFTDETSMIFFKHKFNKPRVAEALAPRRRQAFSGRREAQEYVLKTLCESEAIPVVLKFLISFLSVNYKILNEWILCLKDFHSHSLLSLE